MRERGVIGLFPGADDHDLTYRLLVSAWAQLRAQALTVASIDERVPGIAPLLRSSMRDAFTVGAADRGGEASVASWACVEGLRHELVRPGSELTPKEALRVLHRVEPDARREPPEGEAMAWA